MVKRHLPTVVCYRAAKTQLDGFFSPIMFRCSVHISLKTEIA